MIIPKSEEKINNLIVEVWNEYLKLEKQHSSDLPEFHAAIHDLQKLMALRIVRREYPEIYPMHKD